MGSTTIDSRAALGTATVAWRVERSVPADRRLLPGLAHTPALAGYVLDLLLALVFESAIKPLARGDVLATEFLAGLNIPEERARLMLHIQAVAMGIGWYNSVFKAKS